MEVIRTIPLILPNDSDLAKTVWWFGQIRRDISEVAFNEGKPLQAIPLQRKVYGQVKGRINSQMTLSAVRSVSGAYSTAKSKGHSPKKPFRFINDFAIFLVGDRGRDASIRKDGLLSIWTVNGRKCLQYKVPANLKPLFNQRTKVNSITLRAVKGQIKANITFTIEVPIPKGGLPVGVDLNETNAVVARSGNRTFFESGLPTKIKNTRTRKTRRRLQIKKAARKAQGRSTRSVRRVQKRLGRKISNRTKDFARKVAKQLVEWAGPSTIVLEDLQFKPRTRKSGGPKALRRRLNHFPYGLLRDCIKRKAEIAGIEVTFVNPAYTSQTCSKCGKVGVRRRHEFKCECCGHRDHADKNAADNIRLRYTTSSGVVGCKSITPEARPIGGG